VCGRCTNRITSVLFSHMGTVFIIKNYHIKYGLIRLSIYYFCLICISVGQKVPRSSIRYLSTTLFYACSCLCYIAYFIHSSLCLSVHSVIIVMPNPNLPFMKFKLHEVQLLLSCLYSFPLNYVILYEYPE